ncbi:MAG: thiamine phosphate synthase [Planctomycetota bacterium]
MTIRRLMAAREAVKNARLYLILGCEAGEGRDPLEVAAAAVAGGVELIQIRLKSVTTKERIEFCRRLRKCCGTSCPPIIVNDDLEAAIGAEAAGVHVGQDDVPVAQARKQAGDRLIVGLSTHSPAQAEEAEAAGADYAGIGAIFPTETKQIEHLIGPEPLEELPGRVGIPVFAIGGVTLANLERIISRGCRKVAVSSAILEADDPEAAARTFHQRLWESGPIIR